MTDLIEVWRGAHADLRDVATPERWDEPSLLPGWTVADIMAHTSWIERVALGLTDPPHEPDWAELPHVRGDFGRSTEVPVDLRRSWSRDEVLAELDAAVAAQAEALRSNTSGVVPTLFGTEMPIPKVLGMRIFDLWVHEQDIRLAVDDPGHLDTPSARFAVEWMTRSLPFLWAKKADAPIGSSVVVTVTGPGQEFTVAAQREPDGRARLVEPPADPTVKLEMDLPNYVALSCGRANARPDDVAISGDTDLGAKLLAQFNIAP